MYLWKMPRENSKVCFEDVFESILSGNDSEIENVSSDEEVDATDYVASDNHDGSDDDGSDDDISDDDDSDDVENYISDFLFRNLTNSQMCTSKTSVYNTNIN
jgi:hypothetical protein